VPVLFSLLFQRFRKKVLAVTANSQLDQVFDAEAAITKGES